MERSIDQVAEDRIEGVSDIGVQRKRNEDSIFTIDLNLKLVDQEEKVPMRILLICDGMGGLRAGDWASSYCCSKIEELVKSGKYTNVNNFLKSIDKTMLIVNNNIVAVNTKETKKLAEAGLTDQKFRAGTTFTLFLIFNGKGYIRHLGDTRIYEIDTENKQTKVLTQDQSAVMREYREHKITWQQYIDSAKKNVLYMCMGIFPSNKLDIYKSTVELKKGASYLLCTDGFWHNIDTQDLIDLSNGQSTVQGVIDRMKYKQRETDNITAFIYRRK